MFAVLGHSICLGPWPCVKDPSARREAGTGVSEWTSICPSCLCLYKRPNLVFYLPVIRDGYSPLPGRPTWLGPLDTDGRGFLTTGNISCRFRDRDIWPVRLSLQETVLKHPKESCISFPSLLEPPWSCIVTACHLEYIYSFPELFWCVISRRAHAHTPYCEIVGLTIK